MRRGLALILLTALIATPSAMAGSGGKWTPVTPDFNQNFNLVGLFRTPDGVLHVGAQQNNAANPQDYDIVHVPISSGGTVGNTSVVAGDWAGVESPDMLANPGGGLLSIWGGIHSTTTGDPLNNGSFAISGDGGNSWAVDPTGPWGGGGTAGGTYVYAEQVSAENAADRTPFETWSHSGVYVHRGLDPNAPKVDYNTQVGGETTAVPDLAVDSGSGALWLGWQNGLGNTGAGVWAQQVDTATGNPVGSPTQMPGSVFNYQGAPESSTILGRTPITGRPGRPGVWMAYPTGYPSATKLLVWKVGDGSSTTLATGSTNINRVAITADPDGRVIVVWEESDGGAGRLFARVSDPNVASWSPRFEIPGVPKASEGWAVQIAAQSGGLIDVLQNVTESDGHTMRFWHTQAVAPPVLGKAVDASVVSGTVLIKLPGSNSFAPLTHTSQIPTGAVIDATKGRVRIVEALPGGKTAVADFFQGVFQVAQARNGLATMALVGGSFAACGKGKGAAVAAKVKVIRQLWGAGKGKFRTKGKYASAAIRGTTWLTQDRCDGTLVKVTSGAVTVRDFKLRMNVVVTKGHSYLAKT